MLNPERLGGEPNLGSKYDNPDEEQSVTMRCEHAYLWLKFARSRSNELGAQNELKAIVDATTMLVQMSELHNNGVIYVPESVYNSLNDRIWAKPTAPQDNILPFVQPRNNPSSSEASIPLTA